MSDLTANDERFEELLRNETARLLKMEEGKPGEPDIEAIQDRAYDRIFDAVYGE